MALATQCPYCHTTFRVANDQLKLRAGLVRCGQCQQTFNGIEHLLASMPDKPHAVMPNALPAAPLAAPTSHREDVQGQSFFAQPDHVEPTVPEEQTAQIAPSTQSLAESAHASELSQEPAHEPASEAPAESLDFNLDIDQEWGIGQAQPQPQSQSPRHADARREPVLDAQGIDDLADQPSGVHVVGETVIEHVASEGGRDDGILSYADETIAESENAAEVLPSFLQTEHPSRKLWRNVMLAIGSVLLLCMLLLQVAYLLRTSLVASYPTLRPVLEQACSVLHCRVGLPSQADALSIDGNELQTLPSPDNKLFALSVQLRNRSALAQNWPHLELTLNDAKDRPVLRKVFEPAVYLEVGTHIEQGIAAKSEHSIKLNFSLDKVKATGYRVEVFYP